MNSLSHQAVAGAGVDTPFFPEENTVIDRGQSLMRWTHVLLKHLVAFATSHVFLAVLGERHGERYGGLPISVVTDLRAFSL